MIAMGFRMRISLIKKFHGCILVCTGLCMVEGWLDERSAWLRAYLMRMVPGCRFQDDGKWLQSGLTRLIYACRLV